jgi:predicted Holliday junction resolvase-like endonuclease
MEYYYVIEVSIALVVFLLAYVIYQCSIKVRRLEKRTDHLRNHVNELIKQNNYYSDIVARFDQFMKETDTEIRELKKQVLQLDVKSFHFLSRLDEIILPFKNMCDRIKPKK